MIYAILLRDFAVNQEKRLSPAVSKEELILIEAGKYRPKVIAPDNFARQMGVKAGNYLGEAQSLCPSALFLPVEEYRYRRLFQDFTLRLLEMSPRLEAEYQATSAVWYTDDHAVLTPLLEKIEKETGINAQVGSASSKFAARVAAAIAHPKAPYQVAEKQEAAFLAPYPVSLLPLDKQMKRRLPLLGITTLGALAALPRLAIWEQFGKHGRWLHELASGIDPRPLSPFKAPERLEAVEILEDGCSDRLSLYRYLETISLQLIRQLNEQEAGQVNLLVLLMDGTVLEIQRQPIPALRENLSLLRLLRQMLDALPVHAPIVELKARLEQIKTRQAVQLSLFAEKKSVRSLQDYLPDWMMRHQAANFYRLSVDPQAFSDERIKKQKIGGL
jgi:hypothetical protein